MPATLTKLGEIQDNVNVDNVAVTLSRAIGANKPCIAVYFAHSSAPADASTCSGGGVTWVKKATAQRGNIRVTLFSADGVVSPSGTSITFTNVGATSPNGNDAWVYESDSGSPADWQFVAAEAAVASSVVASLGSTPPSDSTGLAAAAWLDNTGSITWDVSFTVDDFGTHTAPTCVTSVAIDTTSPPISVTANYSGVAANTVSAYVSVQAAGGGGGFGAGGFLIKDTFTRSSSNGWTGVLDSGQHWLNNDGTSSSGTNLTMDGSTGKISRTNVSTTENQIVSNVAEIEQTAYMEFQFDKLPVGVGSELSIATLLRYLDQDNHLYMNMRVSPDGSGTLGVGMELATVDSLLGSYYNYSAGTFAATTWYAMRIQATGTSPTTVRGKAWALAGAEPGWQQEQTNSDSVFQAALSVGLRYRVDPAISNSPIVATFDNYLGNASTGLPVILFGGL